MQKKIFLFVVTLLMVVQYATIQAANYVVNTVSGFNNAQTSAQAGDTITWNSGTFSGIDLNIVKSNLVILAEAPGKTIFTGASKLQINGSYNTIGGFQFLNGNIKSNQLITVSGSHNQFNQINIKDYYCTKYFVINSDARYNLLTHCNFERRAFIGDKNILSILVSEQAPGYNTIRYCSFKDFPGNGGDEGMEPIRIGLSTQGEFISRTTVEYCYFTECNGDGEIISNKSRQNVFRYNTFEDNPKAELVLRHGDEAVVYGNFFLNGMGGVRIKEGQHHVLFNNYFANLAKYPINLQNYNVDPLDSITIAYNTIVNSQNIRLGKAGTYPPKHVTFANNIFYNNQSEKLFMDATGTENWIGNISYGILGFARPEGITDADPAFTLNQQGFYELSAGSPAINSAQPGYPDLPNYPDLGIDYEIMFDLIRNERPKEISLKDVGCIEFSTNTLVKPFATAENTGPFYLHNADTVFSERPNVTGASKVVNNIDDFVEASSDMEGTIYLVKYGLNATKQTVLDSLVTVNLGRKTEIPAADTIIQIFTRGLPGDYYQYYAVSADGRISLPSSTWIIVEEKGLVTEIKETVFEKSFSAYSRNGLIVIQPKNEENYTLEILNVCGKLLYKEKHLYGRHDVDLSEKSGLLLVRKSNKRHVETLKLVTL